MRHHFCKRFKTVLKRNRIRLVVQCRVCGKKYSTKEGRNE